MESVQQQKITVELIWWVFTALVVILVMLPVWLNAPAFPFVFENILLVVLFITFSRYIFLLPLTLIARSKWVKVAIIGSSVLLLFVVATAMIDFRNFMDEEGLQTLVDDLKVHQQTRIMRYIKQEMIFFGTASLITGVMLPFRMIVSLWRMRNSDRV
jgi:hypothetical protein